MSAAHGAWRKRRRPKPSRRGLLPNPLRRIICLGRYGDGERRPTDPLQGDSSWPSDADDVTGARRAPKLPERGCEKIDRRGAARQAFVLAMLIFRHRHWWIRKSTSTAAQAPGISAGRPEGATRLRPVSLCVITVRRGSASARLFRKPIPRSAFPKSARVLSPRIRAAKRVARLSLLQCLKPGSLAPGRQAPHGSQK
jgi:hypothetical protein